MNDAKRPDNRPPYEFDCQRCSIRAIQFMPPLPETIYYAECRFLEDIEDPQARQQAEAFLRRRDQGTAQGTTELRPNL